MWTIKLHLRYEAKNTNIDYAHVHAHAQLCPTLCDPMNCSLPGSSAHGISMARILKWVAISYSRVIFPTQGSNSRLLSLLHLAGRFFPSEPPVEPLNMHMNKDQRVMQFLSNALEDVSISNCFAFCYFSTIWNELFKKKGKKHIKDQKIGKWNKYTASKTNNI